MKIIEFEKLIEDKIVQRGRDYYKKGAVKNLELADEIAGVSSFCADVEGSEIYEVTAELSDEGEIISSECTCPYDMGEFCKHEVAVFYALSDQFSLAKDLKKPKKKSKAKLEISELLAEADKETLAEILLEYAKNDREIKADLRLRLGNLKDVAESARKLIRVDLRKYTKSGFIDYHDMRHAVEGMYKVLNMVCGGAYDAVMRIRLCVVVLEEITGILGSCDDSNGEVCDIIYSATNRISKTIEENSERVEIFDIVFNHACAGFYDNWIDWRLDLLTTLVPLCGNADLRKKLTAYLSCGLECGDGDAENILYAIIKRFDGECAGETYVNSHLYNRSFRKTAIETAMSREQYELALSLCTDGEKADKNNGNLIIWKEYRYKIYEKQGMREGMRELGREFVLIGKYDIGFDYFKKLKPLYSAEEWDTVRDSLISAIENAPKGPYSYGFYSHRDMYIKILIHEKLKENLLIYCQKNPRDLEDLYRNLLPDYKNEISQIFEPYIFSQAEQASDRSSYQKVCITIQHSAKACGIEFAKPIIQTLYEKYRKKPAFLDELSQALK